MNEKIRANNKPFIKEFAVKLGEAEQSRKAGLKKLEIVLFASAVEIF